jgi:hypothetical protein
MKDANPNIERRQCGLLESGRNDNTLCPAVLLSLTLVVDNCEVVKQVVESPSFSNFVAWTSVR